MPTNEKKAPAGRSLTGAIKENCGATTLPRRRGAL